MYRMYIERYMLVAALLVTASWVRERVFSVHKKINYMLLYRVVTMSGNITIFGNRDVKIYYMVLTSGMISEGSKMRDGRAEEVMSRF